MRTFTSECNLTKSQDIQITTKINEKLRKHTAGNTAVYIPFGDPKLTSIRGGYMVEMLLRSGKKRTTLKFTINK